MTDRGTPNPPPAAAIRGQTPSPLSSPDLPQAVRVGPDLELSAASRLVPEAAGPRTQAARRMISAAAVHGIDLSLMWATVERASSGKFARASQVCLAVPGAGRTVMLIVSGPAAGNESRELAERAACINAACDHFAAGRSGRDVRLAQALPEPSEPWAAQAFRESGFLHVGDLAYLRRPLWPALQVTEPTWPDGVTVRTISGSAPGDPDRPLLLQALNRSYEDTLDCPELCGLRSTEDILESHRATGIFNPRLWWLVLMNNEPQGCMLLSRCPDHNSVELVYLGLSPALRGKGLGRRLLELGLARLAVIPADHITCAVDLRNVPARRLYERLGFRDFGKRIAMVRPLAPPTT